MIIHMSNGNHHRKDALMSHTEIIFDYKGYRLEGDTVGAMSLFSPEGKFLELVDDDEDAWRRIDLIWEAKES